MDEARVSTLESVVTIYLATRDFQALMQTLLIGERTSINDHGAKKGNFTAQGHKIECLSLLLVSPPGMIAGVKS